MPTIVRQSEQSRNGRNRVRFAGETIETKNTKNTKNTKRSKGEAGEKGKKKQQQVGKKSANVTKATAKATDSATSSSITLANRFLPLDTDSSGDELIREINTRRREPRTTADHLDNDMPIVTKVIAGDRDKRKSKGGKKKASANLRITLTQGQPRKVAEAPSAKEVQSANVPRFHQRPYLQSNTIREWLKKNIHTVQDGQTMTASQGASEHIDRFANFAAKTAFAFDQLTRALFDVQVWSFYLQLGTRDHHPYWAKQVVHTAKTREDARARQVCENRILKLNSEIKRLTDEIQTTAAQDGLQKEDYEEVMCNYMNESLVNVRRQNELKMKMAKIERAEHVAWENLMNIATPSQKALALTAKGHLTQVRTKNIRYETAAAHASPQIDMLPKGVPGLELRFKFDEKSMAEENVKDIYKCMDDITRDYRLKATELYVRTAKAELDYHTARLQLLTDESILTPSAEGQGDENEAAKAFQIFVKVHRHHTAALTETSVLSLKERRQKVDAPDPTKSTAATETALIPVPELLNQIGQIQEILLLNRN